MNRQKFSKNSLKLVFFVCLAAITVLSVIPDENSVGTTLPRLTPSGFFMHVFAYFITCLFGFLAYKNYPAKMITFLLVYSASLEWLQRYLPSRAFNTMDLIANACGVLAALAVIIAKNRIQR